MGGNKSIAAFPYLRRMVGLDLNFKFVFVLEDKNDQVVIPSVIEYYGPLYGSTEQCVSIWWCWEPLGADFSKEVNVVCLEGQLSVYRYWYRYRSFGQQAKQQVAWRAPISYFAWIFLVADLPVCVWTKYKTLVKIKLSANYDTWWFAFKWMFCGDACCFWFCRAPCVLFVMDWWHFLYCSEN